MKYIRTKDGIIDLTPYREDKEINGAIRFISKLNSGYMFIQKNDIIKQADTIEELCDWKVYRPNGKIKYLVDELASLGQCFAITDYKNWYGALDTDKGLIYVAKMNEKGKLELL